jgi:hypothetical protein
MSQSVQSVRARTVLIPLVAALVCLFPLSRSVNATVRDEPLKFQLVEVQRDGAVLTWALAAKAGRTGVLAGFQIGGDAQALHSVAPTTVQEGASVRFTVRTSAGDNAARCIIRYGFDGRTHEVHLILSEKAADASPGAVRQVLASPPSPPASADDDGIQPEFAAIGDFSVNWRRMDEIELFGKKEPYGIRVHGRIVYQRPEVHGDPAVTIGASKATVRVYDNDFFGDKLLAQGTTDWFGYFDVDVNWKGTNLDPEPDLYVEFLSSNNLIKVERPLLENAYRWRSSIHTNFDGIDLDVGTLEPDNSDEHQALHILTTLTRAWRWSDVRGHPLPFAEVKWPSAVDSYYNPVFETVHIDPDEEWSDATQIHEWGHHWTHSLGAWITPVYTHPNNGEFGHCSWCSENEIAAYIEGWANWISDIICKSFEGEYGVASTTWDDAELVAACHEDNLLHDPFETESFFAAVLRDIQDGAEVPSQNEEDNAFSGDNLKDVLSLGPEGILEVAALDDPIRPGDYLEAFRDRFPSSRCDLWETARNSGFELDDFGPGAVTNIVASSAPGPSHCGTPLQALKFDWTPPTDDWSCAGGYSISITTTPQAPDGIAELGAVTSYVTPCLPGPAIYYFNIRARDRAGHWSTQVASYQFEFYGPPTLVHQIDLKAARVGANVHLTWTPVDDTRFRSYGVYRATTAGMTQLIASYTVDGSERALVDTEAPGTTLYYRVVAADADGTQTGSSKEVRVDAAANSSTPALTAFTVRQNHPNPFSTMTEVDVGLTGESDVAIDVFDVMGRRVKSIVTPTLARGWQKISVTANDEHGHPLPSGVYFFRARANGSQVIRKMIIAR